MSQGSLGGVPFAIDPESIAYHYDVKSSSTNTVGGKVVQVYGTKVSDLIVTGSFGIGGWQAQQAFLQSVTNQMNSQVGSFTANGYVQGAPLRFLYPPRGWDFQVYLLNYTQPGGVTSIVLDNAVINPKWTLTLFMVDDNGGLSNVQDAALASYLSRLATGLGWEAGETENGPINTQATDPSALSPITAAAAAQAGKKTQSEAGRTKL